MQIALKKTLRKVAAVSTSLALAGITVTGALATGLDTLPAPFGSSPASNVVVYGSAGSDTAAVNDVLVAVGGQPVSGTSMTLSSVSTAPLALSDFQSGERKSVVVGTELDAKFGTQVDDTNSAGLREMKVTIDIGSDKDYDAHETINFPSSGGPKLTTALDEGNKNFKDAAFLKVPSKQMDYQLKFEENLDTNNKLSNASSDATITLPFLGKNLVITSATATSVTAYAGDKVSLKVGDTISAAGKTIRLDGVSDTAALITVDGSSESIKEAKRKRVNGVEVYVDTVFNSNDDANDKAVLVVQGDVGQAVDTYSDGEAFINEDSNEYLWAWKLSGLDQTAKGSIVLGVTLEKNLASGTTTFDDKVVNLGLMKENKAYLTDGDYLCLPYRYACLVLEGPDGDFTWHDYTIDATVTQDLNLTYLSGTFTADVSQAQVVQFKASGVGTNRGFSVLEPYAATPTTQLATTNTMWVYFNGTGSNAATAEVGNATEALQIFYKGKDSSNPIRADLDGNGSISVKDNIYPGNNSRQFATFDNGDYNAGIWVQLIHTNFTTTDEVKFTIAGLANPTSGNLTFYSNVTATGVNIGRFGTQVGQATTNDVLYGTTDVTGYDNDVRGTDGYVLKDLKSNIDNDQILMSVPNTNDYKYWVRIAKPNSGGASVTTTGTTTVAALAMKDTDVADVTTLGKNVVAVGGPAVNKVTAQLLGLTFPTYGDGVTGLAEGKAVLELKDVGSKKALLVYGWEADDTRRAALVVKNAAQFSAQLKDKTSVTVLGTSLEVSGITFA